MEIFVDPDKDKCDKVFLNRLDDVFSLKSRQSAASLQHKKQFGRKFTLIQCAFIYHLYPTTTTTTISFHILRSNKVIRILIATLEY